MSKINAVWHKANRMPTKPTVDQRIAWHIDHAANCACRKPTPGVLAMMRKRAGELEPDAAAELQAAVKRLEVL